MTIPKFRTAKVGINNENNKEELKNFSFLRRLVSHRCGNPLGEPGRHLQKTGWELTVCIRYNT